MRGQILAAAVPISRGVFVVLLGELTAVTYFRSPYEFIALVFRSIVQRIPSLHDDGPPGRPYAEPSNALLYNQCLYLHHVMGRVETANLKLSSFKMQPSNNKKRKNPFSGELLYTA